VLTAQGAGGIGPDVLTAQGAGGIGPDVLALRLTPLVTTKSAIATTADHLLIDPPEGNNGRSL
jgi:hypothetical protein